MRNFRSVTCETVRRIALGSWILVFFGASFPAAASAQTCQDLWVERNSYYKDAGYCFKTARAISYFGNANCAYDSEGQVPLSQWTRARIERITRLERRFGCR